MTSTRTGRDRAIDEYIATGMDSIGGWFKPVDARLFASISLEQRRSEVRGDVLEIGAFHGRSSVLLGYLVEGGERLHVCDVFGPDAGTGPEHAREQDRYYPGLGRDRFEANYRRFHGSLPVIHQTASGRLGGLPPSSFRMIHIDGSHLYEEVGQDLRLATRLLTDGGIIIVDDYRVQHTPGVAAALWGLVTSERLQVVAVTKTKAYVGAASDGPALKLVPDAVAVDERLVVVDEVMFGSVHPDIPVVRLAPDATPRRGGALRRGLRALRGRWNGSGGGRRHG